MKQTAIVEPTSIQAELVQDQQRLNFLPHYFGRLMGRAESLVFDYMRTFSPDYCGGYWNFYALDNGGCYMAPTTERMRVEVASNGYQGDMSGDAAGIVACLFMLNTLVCRLVDTDDGEALADTYYALRDFAAEHAEANAIFGAID